MTNIRHEEQSEPGGFRRCLGLKFKCSLLVFRGDTSLLLAVELKECDQRNDGKAEDARQNKKRNREAGIIKTRRLTLESQPPQKQGDDQNCQEHSARDESA